MDFVGFLVVLVDIPHPRSRPSRLGICLGYYCCCCFFFFLCCRLRCHHHGHRHHDCCCCVVVFDYMMSHSNPSLEHRSLGRMILGMGNNLYRSNYDPGHMRLDRLQHQLGHRWHHSRHNQMHIHDYRMLAVCEGLDQ